MLKLLAKTEVFSDGKHNAFTDLLRYRDQYFLAFRNGTEHGTYDGKIMLMHSKEGREWSQPLVIVNTPTDDRDPKFFAFADQLFCTFQTRWADKKDPNHRRPPQVSSSADGFTWSEPVSYFEAEYVPWRPKERAGVLYNALYRYHSQDPASCQVVLVKSSDGLKWDYVSTIYKGDAANETELHFAADDYLWAVVRREKRTTVLARAAFPFVEWEYQDLGFAVHAPCLREIGGKLVLAGREYTAQGAGVFLWVYSGGTFVKALEIEPLLSGQDCAYCGLEETAHGEGLLSYYKGTGYKSDLWLAIFA